MTHVPHASARPVSRLGAICASLSIPNPQSAIAIDDCGVPKCLSSWTPTACSGRSPASRTRSSSATAGSTSSPSSASARAACRSRGASRARSREITGHDVPTGALDITLYRDDLMRHAVGPQPVVRSTEIPFSIDDQQHPAGRRRAVHRPDDPRGARRADRLRPAARRFSWSCSSTAATASCRSRPTTSARTCRPRASESVQVRLQEIDGRDEVVLEEERHERRPPTAWQRKTCSASPTCRADEIDLDPRHRRGDAGDRRAADQEGADAARQDGRQPVLRAEHAHAHVVRDRREAAERRHAQHRRRHVERASRARRSPTRR